MTDLSERNTELDANKLQEYRDKVLHILADAARQIRAGTAVWPVEDFEMFEVFRTNDRKGYRDPRGSWINDSPYQEDPRVKIVIEIEVPDHFSSEVEQLVESLVEGERLAKVAQREAEIFRARQELEAAQARLEELQSGREDCPKCNNRWLWCSCPGEDGN